MYISIVNKENENDSVRSLHFIDTLIFASKFKKSDIHETQEETVMLSHVTFLRSVASPLSVSMNLLLGLAVIAFKS